VLCSLNWDTIGNGQEPSLRCQLGNRGPAYALARLEFGTQTVYEEGPQRGESHGAPFYGSLNSGPSGTDLSIDAGCRIPEDATGSRLALGFDGLCLPCQLQQANRGEAPHGPTVRLGRGAPSSLRRDDGRLLAGQICNLRRIAW
jgi:hypothetical protein